MPSNQFSVFILPERGARSRRRPHYRDRDRSDVATSQGMNVRRHQKLEETRQDSSPESAVEARSC